MNKKSGVIAFILSIVLLFLFFFTLSVVSFTSFFSFSSTFLDNNPIINNDNKKMQRAAISTTTTTTTTPSSPIKQMKNSFLNLYKLMSTSTTTTSTTTAKAESVGNQQDNNNDESDDNINNEINNRIIDGGKLLRTYKLNDKGLFLTVAQGSVVDFRSTRGAIVNAANEGCLGGGGVDGAISKAGGINLHEDRVKLPKILVRDSEGTGTYIIRCPTGEARLTGNGEMRYDSLHVPYVIHAVGPNYMMFDEENDVQTPHRLLYSAYYGSMQATSGTPIRKVAFSLLSAGIFRGSQSLGRVLGIGVTALKDWANHENKLDDDDKGDNGDNDKDRDEKTTNNVEDIVLFAFTDREAQTLLRVCDKVFGDDSPHINPPTPPPTPEESDDSGVGGAKDAVEKKEEMEVEDSVKAGREDSEIKSDEKKNAEATKDEESKPDSAVEEEQESKVCPASTTNANDDLTSGTIEKDADEKKEDHLMTDSEEKQLPTGTGTLDTVEAQKEGGDDEIMTDTEVAAEAEAKDENEGMITESGANSKEESPAKDAS